MSTPKTVNIQIIGQNYPVQCAADEVSTLETAAAHINAVMHDIRRQAPSLEREKLMVLASLTICKDLFEAQKNEQDARQSTVLLQKMVLEVKQMLRE